MHSQFVSVADIYSLDREDPINIPWMAMRRAQRRAVELYGSGSSTSHDRAVVKHLFREGHISDVDREILLSHISAIAERRHKITRTPSRGFRLW